jgi:protein Mpv17
MIADIFFQAVVEQFSYGPFAMVSFFFGMSLLEGKSCNEGANEVRAKFWPTMQVSMTVIWWQNHVQNKK